MGLTHIFSSISFRPVRINLELNDSLKMIGKRAPFLTRYKVSFPFTLAFFVPPIFSCFLSFFHLLIYSIFNCMMYYFFHSSIYPFLIHPSFFLLFFFRSFFLLFFFTHSFFHYFFLLFFLSLLLCLIVPFTICSFYRFLHLLFLLFSLSFFQLSSQLSYS